MSEPQPAIACHGLSCGYQGSAILTEITLTVPPGSVKALLGPNGCGKSTLLKTISGELNPLKGTLEIAGRPASEMTQRERAQKVAFIPPEERTDFPFLVREIVAMGRIPHSEGLFDSKEDKLAVEEAMNRAECGHLADRLIMNISAGERQRALLARALAQQAPILLMDEPTSHLDPGHQVSFARLVRSLATSGFTVLIALHDLNLAAHLADEAILIHEGRITEDGPTRQVLESEGLDQAYATPFERIKGSDGILRLSPKFAER